MKSTAPRWWRRRGAPLGAAAACAVAAVAGTSGSTAAESLFSFDLVGGARTFSMYYDAPGQGRAGEGTVPEASTSLTTGNIGYGLASMFWPGPILGNLGTLIVGVGGPPEARDLDWDVRAEARTPQDPPTTTNRSVPGTLMTATAKGDLVEAVATVSGIANAAISLGATDARSLSRLDGGKGVVRSTAIAQDIVLGGGLVRIESVVSTATAETDGSAATGAGRTIVKGLTVAGVPVTVGEQGITAGGQGVPANAVVNQIARQALSQAGMTLVLSAPTKEITGETAVVDSGALTIVWNAREGGIFGVVLGGARARVTGSPSIDDLLADVSGSIGTDTFPGDGGAGDFTGDGVGSVDPAGDGVLSSNEAAQTIAADGGPGGVPLSSQPASSVGGKAVKPGIVLLALLGAGFVAMAMRRVGDDVLAEQAAATNCPLSGG